jgi:hypothetical protein
VLAMSASFLIVGIASTHADDVWKGQGWYVVAYQYAVILWSGPYATKDACQQAKPAEDDPPGFSYDCSWIDQEPKS